MLAPTHFHRDKNCHPCYAYFPEYLSREGSTVNTKWQKSVAASIAIAAFAATMTLAADIASAQTPPQAIAFRKGAMQVQQWHLRIMIQMIKGARPFDQALFLRDALAIENSTASVADGFIPGSDTGNTRALPLIWSDAAGFKVAVDRFKAEAAKTVAVAKRGDEKAMRTQGLELVRACESCHDRFQGK